MVSFFVLFGFVSHLIPFDLGVNAQVGLLLVGRALVIPQWLNLFQVIRELPTGSTIIEQQKNSSGKKSVWKNLR